MKETIQRKERDSWERFLQSGKVEDYLSYVSCMSVKMQGAADRKHPEGDGSHAGFYTGDRYYIETDAYR